MDAFEIRVLGPVEILHDGEVRSVTSRERRVVLSLLVISLDHPVPIDVLSEALWCADRPASAISVLHSIVSRLRRDLPPDTLCNIDSSYALRVTPDVVDACRFEAFVSEAARSLESNPSETLEAARGALRLWRGEPYIELADTEVGMLEAQRMHELRRRAMELHWEAELVLGDHERIIGSLEAALGTDPYREHLWYLLIVALARAGRRVEAVRAYDRLRETLEGVGLEPTADLRDLPGRILEDDASMRPRFERVVESDP